MSELTSKMDALDKQLGRGATYAPGERQEILDGVAPEWLLRCRLLLAGDDKAWATKLLEGLRKARAQLWPKVRFSDVETTPPPAGKIKGEH